MAKRATPSPRLAPWRAWLTNREHLYHALVVVTFPLVLWAVPSATMALSSPYRAAALGLLLGLGVLAAGVGRGRTWPRWDAATWAWAVVVPVAGLAAAFAGERPPVSLQAVLWGYVLPLGVAAGIAALAEHRPRWVEDGLLLTGGIALGQALVLAGRWYLAWLASRQGGILPPVPLRVQTPAWPNPNLLAFFLPVPIFLAWARVWQSRRPWPRRLWQFYLAGLLLVEVLTVSRGGWLAFLIAATAWMLYHAWRTGWKPQPTCLACWLWAVYGAFLLGLAGWSLYGRMAAPPPTFHPAWQPNARLLLWRAAWTAWRQHGWLGLGPANFALWLHRWRVTPPFPEWSHAHNTLLQVAAEGGVLGLAALVLGVAALARPLRQWRVLPLQGQTGLAVFLAWGVHSLVDAPLPGRWPSFWLVFFAVGGLMWAAARRGEGRRPGTKEGARRLRWGASAWWVAWAALLVAGGVFLMPARQAAARSVARGLQGRWDEAAQAAEDAARHEPTVAVYRFQAAYAYAWQAWEAAAAGETYARGPALDRAIAAYRQGLALEPWHATLWRNLGVLLWAQGQPEAARRALQQAVQAAPHAAPLYADLGWLEEQQGHDRAAAEAYRTALHLDPSLADTVFFAAPTPPRAAARQSEAAAVAAWRSQPDQAAWAAYDRGDLSLAERLFLGAAYQGKASIFAGLAAVALRRGDMPQAAGWRRFLLALPNHEAKPRQLALEALWALAHGQCQEAREALAVLRRQTLWLTPGEPLPAQTATFRSVYNQWVLTPERLPGGAVLAPAFLPRLAEQVQKCGR